MKDDHSFCPICGHAQFLEKQDICRCCGFELGYHNTRINFKQLQKMWIADSNYFKKIKKENDDGNIR